MTRNSAIAWIAQHHRHLKRTIAGWLFGISIDSDDGRRLGVACAARPHARKLQDGETFEIKRVAVVADAPMACSFAYGSLRRAGYELGYQRCFTYTRLDESGESLRGAGFIYQGTAGGGEADRPSRKRQKSEDPSVKRRWVHYSDHKRNEHERRLQATRDHSVCCKIS